MTKGARERADELFEFAKAKSDAGDEQSALTLYLESLALNRDQLLKNARGVPAGGRCSNAALYLLFAAWCTVGMPRTAPAGPNLPIESCIQIRMTA